MSETLFDQTDDEDLIRLYAQQGRTLDDLPYTLAFEGLYEAVGAMEAEPPSRQDLLHRLHNLRKAGRLPRLGAAPSPPPRIAPEHEQALEQLVQQQVGELSKRDRLLYTPEFDRIVHALNARGGLNLEAHDVWRLIARLSK